MHEDINELMRKAQWVEAADLCKKKLLANPTNGMLHAYEGMCYYRQAKYLEAESCFRRAYTLDPKLTEAAVKHAQCLEKLRRYRDAMDVVKEWMPQRPNDIAFVALYDHLKLIHSSEEHEGWERSRRHDFKLVESLGVETA